MQNIIIETGTSINKKPMRIAKCRFSGRVLATAQRRPFETAEQLDARLIASATDASLIAMRDNIDRAIARA